LLEQLHTSEGTVLTEIKGSIHNKDLKKITYFNQNTFNKCYSNPELRKVLRSDFEIFCDGRGMAFALRFLFGKKVEKFNATDLYTKVFNKFYEEQQTVYLIGGNYNPELISEYTRARIFLSGYSNGYDNVQNLEFLIQKIKQSNSNIIGIGMGTPKQEILAYQISLKLENCIILCVGNFFNFYFGLTRRAPDFLRNSGFEWMYRLFTEPFRLWKRYVVGIPLFIFRIIKYKYF
jgi:N-acetylglucosaminyldiphosphoundecaprenol N-acetyl-beta-D-mannosaminyltransferase